MIKKTQRTTPSRYRHQAAYDEATIHAILDEALFCYVAYCSQEQAFIIPTAFVRKNNQLYLHGSVGSHFIRAVKTGIPVCIAVTLVDALVVAKAAFDHNINYRSVILFSQATEITDPGEQLYALELLTNKMVPNSWNYVRPVKPGERKKTTVLAFPIREASAKTRTGMPPVSPQDQSLPIWSGLIPFQTRQLTPVADSFSQNTPLPAHLQPITG